MILPLPVSPGVTEDSVQFVNLAHYREFFVDLDSGFPKVIVGPPASFGAVSRGSIALPKLEVHRVGHFEASFVPSLSDFARLDPRFRIADSVWRALPQYEDWGFAVFKLIDLGRGLFRKRRTIHPMALWFPTRDADRLFFPTVHIHDGRVHPNAQFDHLLYHQSRPTVHGWRWETSVEPAARFVDLERARGLVDAELRMHRLSITGVNKNEDVWLPVTSLSNIAQ